MKRGLGNHGAVTVLVTLLLIPAVLITGTGVDLARIYTSRSVLQDADQLALNSVLADYNALLQDLYGLFGVTLEDEELKNLVNKYVEKAIFAKDSSVTGNNLLRLFYGTDAQTEIKTGEGQDLGNIDQLRRQIEEYSKIRAPIILANEVIDRLKSFSKVNADADIIEDKIDIEEKIEDIDKYYEKIFQTLEYLDGSKEVGGQNQYEGYKALEDAALITINGVLINLESNFHEMLRIRKAYESALEEEEPDEEKIDDLEAHFEALKDNCIALLYGGAYGENWDDEEREWGYTDSVKGLQTIAKDFADELEKYISKGQLFAAKTETLENLKDHCEKADKEKKELKEMIDALREKLETSDCHDELKESLSGEGGLLDTYEELVKYDLTGMAEKMYEVDEAHISALVDRLRAFGDEVCYATSSPQTTLYTLDSLRDVIKGMDIDITITNRERAEKGLEPLPDDLAAFGDGATSSPKAIEPYSEYLTWLQCGEEFSNPDYKEFLETLKKLYSGTNSADKKKAKKSVTNLFEAAQDFYSGLIVEPKGAWLLVGASGGGSSSSNLGEGSDWSAEGNATSELKNALGSSFLDKLGGLLDSVANKALLFTYTTEMFSCYTTKSGDENMAGIPMSTDVNYFFQSELEYVYNGDLTNAINNHNAVGSMILIIRLVMNYLISFSIGPVNDVVSAIRNALAGLGPIALAVSELARLAMAIGESFVDLSLLRNGHKVAFLKDDDSWKLQLGTILDVSVGSLMSSLQSGAQSSDDTGSSGSSDDPLEDDNGLSYFDYLRIFLLFVEGDVMADRVRCLIELNMTNKINNLGTIEERERRESAMADAERFLLSSARTGFVLTVSADMDMLFLSMPFAQEGLNGVIPPKTFPISAEGYRGY